MPLALGSSAVSTLLLVGTVTTSSPSHPGAVAWTSLLGSYELQLKFSSICCCDAASDSRGDPDAGTSSRRCIIQRTLTLSPPVFSRSAQIPLLNRGEVLL